MTKCLFLFNAIEYFASWKTLPATCLLYTDHGVIGSVGSKRRMFTYCFELIMESLFFSFGCKYAAFTDIVELDCIVVLYQLFSSLFNNEICREIFSAQLESRFES